MTVAIAFAGGTYGTYLEWCLTALTTKNTISIPFTANGSSHGFIGNHLQTMHGWNQFIKQNSIADFARLHPKTTRHESLSDNLAQLCDQSDFVLHLYPTKNSTLLCINNYFTKVWSNWWQYQFLQSIDPDVIYKNWPVATNTAITDIATWIKREFLSFYMMPAWYDMIEWYHPDKWQHQKCLIVSVDQLLFDFEQTLSTIQLKAGIEFVQPVEALIDCHVQNIKAQQFLHVDQLCNKIIDSVCNNINFDWQPLGLCSESWIQWQLRNCGLELQCHGLDMFPTNSIQLRNLTYSV